MNELQDQEPIKTDSEVHSLELLNRSEIDMQIATAHKFPRSIKRFNQEALDMATLDEETATSCFYRLKRGGKVIEGPSARLAEITQTAWGNIRCGSRIIEESRKFVVAQAVCHDLEKNVASTVEVRRRITDKNGRSFNDDMVTVTCNAAMSIAYRNAIFKVIPGAYTRNILRRAKEVSVGTIETLAQRRGVAIDYINKMGVETDRILSVLGREGIEDIGLDDLATLKGLITAIKDGDTTVDEAFEDDTRRNRPPMSSSNRGPNLPCNKSAPKHPTKNTSTVEEYAAPSQEELAEMDPNELWLHFNTIKGHIGVKKVDIYLKHIGLTDILDKPSALIDWVSNWKQKQELVNAHWVMNAKIQEG